jgi:hypothetical protein
VRLEASTKPHVYQKIEIFWTNIASIIAYPNFKNGPKKGLGPLGVNIMVFWNFFVAKSYEIIFARPLLN